MNFLELLPAVDVKDGRAVRLVQGELARESIYGSLHLKLHLIFKNQGPSGYTWLIWMQHLAAAKIARFWQQSLVV